MKKLKNRLTGLYALLCLSIVIGYGCNSNGQGAQSPTTTIHEAAFMGNASEINAHIQAGSDLNEKDAFGSAPLTIASVFGKPEVARLLVEAGADIDIQSADGSTPLHSASFFCRKEIVALLLENGADVSIRNNYGSTALESMQAPWDAIKPVYDQVTRDLGPLGLKLDYDYVMKTRPEIAGMIRNAQ